MRVNRAIAIRRRLRGAALHGVLVTSLLAAGTAWAGPRGGEIVGGSGSIRHTGHHTRIDQSSGSMAIDWASFNVGSNESVRFVQPSATAVVLNRILDLNPTEIYGQIDANGRVFLLNPNGIVFGETAQINVGSLVAGAMDMSADDFMAGRYQMRAGETPGAVVNHGFIAAATGGSVAMVGGHVRNTGTIVADYGRITLAGAERAFVDFDGDGLIRIEVTGKLRRRVADTDAAVENSGVLQAAGGQVVMKAAAARGLFDTLVNNTGMIRAGAIDRSGGVVRLVGMGGDVVNSGTIDASSVERRGGTVVLESDHGSFLDSGSILVNSRQARGGTVRITGERVVLVGPVRIDGSGAVGGGTVLIGGGGLPNRDPNIRNASRTFIGPETVINVSSRRRGPGGRVIVWSEDYTRFFGTVSARGPPSGHGGFVQIASNGLTELDGAQLDVSGGAIGGEVRVLGDLVGLFGATRILATGLAGGGTVLIGGDYQGSNPVVRNASRTYVGPDALIDASALALGDGGRVIVWSDGTTLFHGQLAARGGALGGNGGFAEVSGKEHLAISGHPDLSAARGIAGSLLLDPGSVSIVNGANTLPAGTLDSFNDAWIEDQLQNFSAVIISTDNSTVGGAENITVDAGVSIVWTSANGFTLEAGEDISLGGTIDGSSAAIVFSVGLDGLGGTLDLGSAVISGSTVTANGSGNDTISGGGTIYTLTDATPDAGSDGTVTWTSFENIDHASGTVDFGASGSVGGDVTAATLDFTGYGSGISVVLSGANAGSIAGAIGGTFSGVSAIDGNGAQSNTMGGSGYTYLLDATTADAGSSQGVSWTAFGNISDATGTVDFNTGGSVGGDVTAATLDFTGYGSGISVVLSGANAGSIAGAIGGTFSGVSAIDGNGAQSNTMGGSGYTYLLDATTADAGSSQGVSWTAFGNISDATGTVDFNTGGSVGGDVTAATLDFTGYGSGISVVLSGANAGSIAGAIGGTFSGVSAIDGNGAQSNTMGGSGYTYLLDATTADAGSSQGVSWTAFGNISDATGTVDFNTGGSVGGDVTAATLDFTGYGSGISVVLSGANAGSIAGAIGGTFSGVSAIDGNGAQSNTMGGSGYTYLLDATTADAGSSQGVSWTAFGNISDATGTVDFNTGGSVGGDVTAATLDFTGYGSGISVVLSGANAGSIAGAIGGTFSGVSAIDGNGAQSNTMGGSGYTYLLDATTADAGSSQGVSWTAFGNISDATGTVDFNTGGSVGGDVTAATLDFTGYGSGISVVLSGANAGSIAGAIGGTFSGVSAIDGNGAQSNTMGGSGYTYLLDATTADAGSSQGVSWTAFGNISDATGTVDFNTGGSVGGDVTAATLDFTGYGSGISVVLSGANAGSIAGAIGGTFSGVSAIDGNGAQSNTMGGSGYTYLLDATTADAGSSQGVSWTAFGNISDATGTVDFNTGGSVGGDVTAATLDFTGYGSGISVVLSGANAGSIAGAIGGTFSGVSAIDGNGAQSNTMGGSGYTYLLDATTADAGSSQGVSWTAFGNISDATGTVDFNTGGSVGGDVTAATLDFTGYGSGISVVLSGANAGSIAGAIGGTFSGVSAIDGNGAQSNTMGGSGYTYLLDATTADAGSSQGVSWTAFGNISDATGTVDFNTGGSVGGDVTAATLDFTGYGSGISVVLSGANAGSIAGAIGGTFSGVSAIDGNGAQSNTMGGSGYTYLLDATTADAGSSQGVSWTAFGNISDATGTVDFNTGGSVGGDVTAATLDFTGYGSGISVVLSGANAGSIAGAIGGTFSGVSAIDGNGAQSNTMGGSGYTYLLDATTADAGSSQGVSWTAFGNISDATGTVDFNTGGSVGGDVTAATLDFTGYGSGISVVLSGANAGSIAGAIGGTFSGVSAIDGNGAQSNTMGGSGYTYLLDATTADAGSSQGVSWTAFGNISDATGTVDFNTGGSVGGDVTAATLDFTGYGSGISVVLSGANAGSIAGAIGGTFSGVSAIDGNGAQSNTMGGSGYTYLLDATTADAGSSQGVSWTAFGNISDATGTVDFNTGGSVGGDVTAATLDFTGYGSGISVVLSGANAGSIAGAIGGTFSGVSAIDGNGAQSNTMGGSGYTYLLDATTADAGSSQGVSWTAFGNISDATGTVDFNTGGSVGGDVTAATLDFTGYGSGISVVLSGANAGSIAGAIGGTFSGVSAIDGNGAQSNTMGGSGYTYLLDATTADAGSSQGVSWTAFGNISDATGTVDFNTGGSVGGDVTAATLDFTGYGSGISVVLSGANAGSIAGAIGGTFSGVSAIDGNGAQSNTMGGSGYTYLLDATTADAGSSQGVSWTAFGNISDATGTVDFNTGGSVGGDVTAATLDFTGYGSGISVVLSGANAGSIAGAIGGTFSGVSAIDGNGAQSNTMGGSGYTYLLDATTADAGSSQGVSWTAFGNISDATGTVDFNTGGSVGGDVTAATLDFTGYGSGISVVLSGANAGSIAGAIGGTFSGVSAIDGNGAQSNTMGGSGYTYLLDATTADAGSSQGVSWTAFGNISDATGTVDFNTGGSVGGDVTAATLDFTGYGSGISVVLSGANAGSIAGAIGGTFSGVSAIDGNGAQSNTMGGSGYTYLLDATTADAGSSQGVSWTAFGNISDATGTVDFNTGGSVGGDVTAATLDFTGYGSGISVVLSGANAGSIAGAIGGTFSGVSAIDGNGAQSNTMGGSGYTYLLDATTADAGSSQGVSWTAFGNISDATGTVDFNTGGSVGGDVTALVLNYGNYSSGITFDLANGVGMSTGIGNTWNGVAQVIGSGNATDAVEGLGGTGSTFSITGNNAFSSSSIAFSDIENVDGNGTADIVQGLVAGADAITIDGAGSITTSLIDFDGIDQVDGRGGSDTVAGLGGTGSTFSITGNNAFSSSSIAFSDIENVDGNGTADIVQGLVAGADAITIDGAGSITTSLIDFDGIDQVDGRGGSDTVAGLGGTGSTFSITGNNAFSSSSIAFSDIENVDGNGTADIVQGLVAGADAITIDGAGSITTSLIDFDGIDQVDGRGGSDTVAGLGGTGSTFSITGNNAFSSSSIAFSDIENVDGNGTADIVQGLVAGADAITIDGAGSITTSLIDFDGIDQVDGRGGSDTVAGLGGTGSTFSITGNNAFSSSSIAFSDIENVDGNGTADIVQGLVAGADAITIDGAGSITTSLIDFDGIDQVDGRGGSDTVAGLGGTGSTFSITGNNAFSSSSIAFSDIENVDGNGTADIVQGLVAGADAITIDGAGSITTSLIDFDGIDQVDGRGGSDTVAGLGGTGSTFSITGNNAFSSSSIAFSDIENVDGNGTADIVQGLVAGADAITIDGAGSITTSLIDFDGIDQVDGRGGSDTVTGLGTADVFTVSGTDAFGSSSIAFSNLESINGAGGGDTFVFSNAATLSGTINGGAGTDTLDLSAYGTSITVDLASAGGTDGANGATSGSPNPLGGGFSNIDAVSGGSAGDTFQVSASVTANLTGNGGADIFDFGNGFVLTGTIAGGAGSDTLDLADYSSGIDVDLTGTNASGGFDLTSTGIVSGQATSIDVVNGGSGSNTLTGINAVATWATTGINDGTYSSTNSLTFTDFGTWQGNGGADTFDLGHSVGTVLGGGGSDVFNVNAAITADLDGEGGNDSFVFASAGVLSGDVVGGAGIDTLNLSAKPGAVAINLQNGTATGISGGTFSGVETFVGNDGTSGTDTTITGPNAGSTWTLTGANSGTIDAFSFSGVGNLTAGTGADSFVGSGGSLTGNLADGGGATTLSGAIQTGGDQTYVGAVTLAADTTLTSTGSGTIDFGSTVNGAFALAASSAGGVVVFGNSVGLTQALTDLDVTAATINLDGATYRIDAAGGNTVIFTGAVVLGTDVTIDTDGAAADNSVTFNGTVDADAAVNGRTLTIGSGAAGTVRLLGTVGGSELLASLTVTSAAGIVVDDVRTGGTVNLTTTGAITHDGAEDVGADITAPVVTLVAGTGIGTGANGPLDVTVSTLSATSTTGNITLDSLATGPVTVSSLITGTGTIQLDQIGDQALDVTLAQTTNGSITLTNDGATLTVTTATAGGGDADDDITLTATGVGGNVAVGTLTATGNDIVVTASEAIDGSADDGVADLIGALVDLNAGTGIGATTTLDISAGQLFADSATGDIDLDSLATSTVIVSSLTTGTGTILLQQTGNQTLTVTTATTTNGDISLTNAGADLTVGTITAGGSGRNVTLTTTTSGDVRVGEVTAAGDQITIQSAGAIEESGADAAADLIVNAGTISLTAVNGIGDAARLELTGRTITVATSGSGAIDLNSLATAATGTVTVTLDAGNGAGGDLGGISFSQTGGEALIVTSATTDDGAIAISNAGDDLTATLVTAAGTSRDVALTTTGSGNVLVGTVTAAGDEVTISAGGAVTGGNQETALTTNVTAALLTVTAGGAITLDTDIGSLDITAAGGTVNIFEEDALTIENIVAPGESVILSADSITEDDSASDVTADSLDVTARTGAVTLETTISELAVSADGNVTIANSGNLLVSSVSAPGRVVTLSAASLTGGDQNTGNGVNVTAETLSATASNGSIALDTTIDTLPVAIAVNGSVTITDSDALQADDISATGSGPNDVTLTAGGSGTLDVRRVVADNAVVLIAGGGVVDGGGDVGADVIAASLMVVAASGPIALDGDVSGDITLTVTSGGGIAYDAVSASGAAIDLSSSQLNLSTPAGAAVAIGARNFTVDDALGSTGDALAGGALSVHAAEDIVFEPSGSISTGVGSGSIQLLADQAVGTTSADGIGAIVNNSPGVTDVTSGALAAEAEGGIDLDTRVDSLSAGIFGLGDLVIDERDAIVVTDARTDDGAITIRAGGSVTVAQAAAGVGGDIAIVSGADILAGALVAVDDRVVLDAAGAVIDDNGGAVNVTAGSLDVTTGTGGAELDTSIGELDADVAGTLTIREDGAIRLENVTAGNVVVTAADTITVVSVRGIGGNNGDVGGNLLQDGGDVVLESTVGDIVLGNIEALDDFVSLVAGGAIRDDGEANVDIAAGSLASTSVGAFGTELDPIELDVPGNIEITTTGAAGHIFLIESNLLLLSRLTTRTGAGMQTQSLGASQITVDADFNAAGDAVILNSAGDILGGGGTVTAESLALLSGGNLGSLLDPVDVQIPDIDNLEIELGPSGFAFVSGNFSAADFQSLLDRTAGRTFVVGQFEEVVGGVQGSFITAPSYTVDSSQFSTASIVSIEGTGQLLPPDQREDPCAGADADPAQCPTGGA